MFVEALNLWELQRGLKQRVQHVEAGFISGEPRALNLHAAKAAHVDRAVFAAAPRTAPLFKLGHLRGAVMDKIVDNILFAKPVTTCNGIVEMVLKAVMIPATAAEPPSAATVWLRMG